MTTARSSITTHVLDISRGRPAKGVPVSLEKLADDGTAKEIARAHTDHDGRVNALLPVGAPVAAGRLSAPI